jgi:hypothetical protein
LFLNIFILAFRNATNERLDKLVGSENWVEYLMDVYIEEMLHRDMKVILFQPEQTQSPAQGSQDTRTTPRRDRGIAFFLGLRKESSTSETRPPQQPAKLAG